MKYNIFNKAYRDRKLQRELRLSREKHILQTHEAARQQIAQFKEVTPITPVSV